MQIKNIRVAQYCHLNEIPGEQTTFFQHIDSNLFYAKSWYENYERHIKNDFDKEVIYVLYADSAGSKQRNQILGMLLLKHVNNGNVLFNFNTHASFANYYTTYHNLLTDNRVEIPAAWDAVIDFLDSGSANITAFNLGPVAENDPGISGLLAGLRGRGWFVYTYDMFGNWYLKLNGRSFDEYYESVPSRIRNTIKRKEKKLIKDYSVDYVLYTDKNDLHSAIDSYQHVYNNSWKSNEPYPEFISGLIQVCADNGWLRLGVIRIDDQPVAVQLWIVKDRVAYIYKLAYTEETKQLSAGSILTEKLMRHVIDVDKVDVIDYLTGDDSYKRDWMSDRRQMIGIMAYRPTVKGRLLAIGYLVKKLLKKLLSPA